jgi:hypothetical protein
MARRKASTRKVGSGTTLVMVPSNNNAPVRRAARRRSSGGRRRVVRRRRSSGSVGAANLKNRMIGHAVGGFAVGFLEKSFPNLPTLPIVGRKGAIAIGAMLLAGKHPIIADIGLAAAAISGYELGSTGAISGDVLGGIASQV